MRLKFIFIILALLVVSCSTQRQLNKMPAIVEFKSQEDIAKANLKTLKKVEDKIFACIAYVEGFESEVYLCGIYTIGYGTAFYPDGSKVAPGDAPITKTQGKEFVISYLRKAIYPYISHFVTRVLNEDELIATSLFIYNVGPAKFAGSVINYKKNGKIYLTPTYTKEGKKRSYSEFLVSLNKDANPVETAAKMLQFINKESQFGKGLLKRSWIQMAIFCGTIKADKILDLTPHGFYNIKRISKYYQKTENGILPDFSEDKITSFLAQNTGKTTVLSTLDNMTRKALTQGSIQ